MTLQRSPGVMSSPTRPCSHAQAAGLVSDGLPWWPPRGERLGAGHGRHRPTPFPLPRLQLPHRPAAAPVPRRYRSSSSGGGGSSGRVCRLPRALFGDLLQKLWAAEEGTPAGRRAQLVEREVQSIRRLLDACRREAAVALPSLCVGCWERIPLVRPLRWRRLPACSEGRAPARASCLQPPSRCCPCLGPLPACPPSPRLLPARSPDDGGPGSASPLQSLEQQEALVAAALHANPSAAASNAVPFSSSAISSASSSSPAAVVAAAAAAAAAKEGGPAAAKVPPPRVEAVRPILPCVFAAEGKLGARAGRRRCRGDFCCTFAALPSLP